MKIPQKILILGKEYNIKKVINPTLDCGKPVDGYFDAANSTIALDSKLRGLRLKQVLVHEMIHALHDRVHADSDVDPAYLHMVTDTTASMIVECFDIKFK